MKKIVAMLVMVAAIAAATVSTIGCDGGATSSKPPATSPPAK